MSSQAQEWINWQKQYFEDMAALGEGLVPPEVTLLDEAKNKVLGAAAAGVTLAALSGAAPAGAEAPAPAPIVRAMGIPILDKPVLETAKPAEEKLAGQYVIERGDSLSRVGRKLGVPLQHLKDANKIDMSNPDLIFRGQIADYDPAKVRKTEPAQQMPNEGDKVVPIVKGDTLGELVVEHVPAKSEESLARRVERTAKDNGISNIHLIYAGENLIIKEAANKVAEIPGIVNPAPAVAAPVPQPELAAASVAEATEPIAPSIPDPEGYVPPKLIDIPPSPPPEAVPAPPPVQEVVPPEIRLINSLNWGALPDITVMGNTVKSVDIGNDLKHLIRDHGFDLRDATDYKGAELTESAGNPHQNSCDNGRGKGPFCYHGNRQKGLPVDYHDMIHFSFEDMKRSGGIRLLDILQTRSEGSATEQETIDRRNNFQAWLRPAVVGRRWYYSDIMFNALMSTPLPPAPAEPAPPATPPPAPPRPAQAKKADVSIAAAGISIDVSAPAPSGPDRQGYVQIPEDPEGRYVFEGFAEPADRWGTPQLVSFAQEVAINFHAKYPGMQTHFGDFNERERGKHASHRNGVDVDFDAKGPAGVAFDNRPGYKSDLTIEYGKIMLMTGKIEFIFFNDPVVIRELNKFAAEKNLPGRVQAEHNHWNHGHARLNTPEGPRVR